jgi:hypothetical protein
MVATINTLSRFREQLSENVRQYIAGAELNLASIKARQTTPTTPNLNIKSRQHSNQAKRQITPSILPRQKILCDNGFAAGHSLDGLP